MKKSAQELIRPDWFNLDKYGPLADMSAREWAVQLKQRFIMLDSDAEDSEKVYKNIISCPITTDIRPYIPGFGDGIPSFGGWLHSENNLLDPKIRYTKLYQKHVVPLGCVDAYWYAAELPDSMTQVFRKDYPDDIFNYVPIDSFFQNQLDFFEGVVNLSVNLNVPDDQLVGEFRAYLEAAREVHRYPEGKRIKKSILKRLCESKVLPYIDLSYWAKANGQNIPNHIIGDWLFPDDMVDVAEKIRKVTEPLAKRSVKPHFIRTLSSLKS